MASEKKLLRPFEVMLLVVGLAMIVLIAIQSKTGKVLQTTENEVFTKGLLPKMTAEKADPLNDLASIFSKKTGEAEPEIWQNLKLDDDEKDFFKNLRNRWKSAPENSEIQNPKSLPDRQAGEIDKTDWLAVLEAARLTYEKVGEIFEDARPENVRFPNRRRLVDDVLSDSTSAEQVFLDLEHLFKIPREAARAFSFENPRSLSEWAVFVEENQQ